MKESFGLWSVTYGTLKNVAIDDFIRIKHETACSTVTNEGVDRLSV